MRDVSDGVLSPSWAKNNNTAFKELTFRLITVSHWSHHVSKTAISLFSWLVATPLVNFHIKEINPWCLEDATVFYLRLFPQHL